MTTTSAPPSRSRRAPILEPTLRGLRVEVARWALATGRPLNLDAIGVILATRHGEAASGLKGFNWWTTNEVLTFLFDSVDAWCRANEVTVPLHLGESLLTYIDFLAEHRLFARGSSTHRQLRTTIIDLAGLTADGHRPAVAQRRPPVVEPILLSEFRRS